MIVTPVIMRNKKEKEFYKKNYEDLFIHQNSGRSISVQSSPIKQIKKNDLILVNHRKDPLEFADIAMGKRVKALDIVHSKRSEQQKKVLESTWKKDEKYRKWSSEKIMKNLFGIKKSTLGNKQRDLKQIEKIVVDRNTYYVGEAVPTTKEEEKSTFSHIKSAVDGLID